MKRTVYGLLTVCIIVFMTACGNRNTSVTYRMEAEENGMSMTETITLHARGDEIHQITEVIEMDLRSFDEATRDLLYAAYDELVASYGETEGVVTTGEVAEGIYTLRISIDATGDAVNTLAEQGLFVIEGGMDSFSLERTGAALESQGYVAAK